MTDNDGGYCGAGGEGVQGNAVTEDGRRRTKVFESIASLSMDYRKLAFSIYEPFCAYCGFGIQGVLEVAHIDSNRLNNKIDNLVILCPTCHKMLDIDLISNQTIKSVRDRAKMVNWKKRMKDAGAKAAQTRKWRQAGKKAAESRKRNLEKLGT